MLFYLFIFFHCITDYALVTYLYRYDLTSAPGTPSTQARLKKVSLAAGAGGPPPPTALPLPPAVGRIVDPLLVYDNLNLGRRIDPVWPEPEWRAKVSASERLKSKPNLCLSRRS